MVRELHKAAGLGFVEVFVDAPLSVVEARDPKGLYKKARAGEIKGGRSPTNLGLQTIDTYAQDFTGISAPYEAPENAEIHINTGEVDVTDSVRIIADYLDRNGYLSLSKKEDEAELAN